MSVIRLGMVQMAALCGQTTQNLSTITRLTDEAVAQGVGLLCFPELALTGYRMDALAQTALPSHSRELEALRGLAVTHGVDLLVGFGERVEDTLYLSQGLFHRDGRLEIYRKTHLGQRERPVAIPGEELPVFTLADGTSVAVALCIEGHVPEIFTTYALRGAQIVLCPYASPRKAGDRGALWNRYVPARAYDNRIFVACCNQLGDNGRGVVFGGGCAVYGPDGQLLAQDFSDHEGILTADLDLERIPPLRQGAKDFLALRRPNLYL